MRWVYGRYLVVFALLVWCGTAHAGDAETIASLTGQLKSSAIARDERVRLLFERGLVYDRQSALDDAIADYSAILEIAPNNSAALNNRANAYRRLGRLMDAKRDYLASLVAGNPKPAYSEYGLGQICESQGDVGGAREHYRRALASDPRYALASQRLAALGPEEAFSTIQLIPPKGAGDPDRVVLKPPRATPVALKKPQPRKSGWTRVAEAKIPKTSDVPLRPAIGEGAIPARTSTRPLGSQRVQLGAWRTKAEAQAGLAKAQAAAGDVLAGAGTEIVEVNIPGKGRYFRLRAGTPSRTAAGQLCMKLKARGLDCIRAPN